MTLKIGKSYKSARGRPYTVEATLLNGNLICRNTEGSIWEEEIQ